MFPVGPMTQPRPSQSPVPAGQGQRAVKMCLGAELTREGLPGPLPPAALPSRVCTLRTDTPTPEAVAPAPGVGGGHPAWPLGGSWRGPLARGPKARPSLHRLREHRRCWTRPPVRRSPRRVQRVGLRGKRGSPRPPGRVSAQDAPGGRGDGCSRPRAAAAGASERGVVCERAQGCDGQGAPGKPPALSQGEARAALASLRPPSPVSSIPRRGLSQLPAPPAPGPAPPWVHPRC